MDYLASKKFSFSSDALDKGTFGVVRFQGSEGLSQPYSFEIMLVSSNVEIDLAKVVQSPARLTIHRDEGDEAVYNGILANFEQLYAVGGFCFYRTYLVPKLWWLSLTHHNQVIQDKSVPDFLADVLKDGGLTSLDFEFRLQGEYAPQEYICQYGETHLNFVSRWCEREGIYYYFEQTPNGEKVIFADSWNTHTDSPQGKTLRLKPGSGLEALKMDEVIRSLSCRRSLVPGNVFMKDYNYLKPSLDITGTASVDPDGRGHVYLYNEHFRTPEEGNRLAKIRAEAMLCRREEFRGEGSVPYMMPGFTFDLEDHFRKDFNQKYMTLDVEHEGNQTGYLISGIKESVAEREAAIYYRNSFTCIKSDVQYRAEARHEKPRIAGTIVAKIDAAGSGKYAELDAGGRYKVSLPFDLSGKKDGKGSAWVRMAQPYAGSDHGMHFPLHKGTEVLLTFIDGDPDRPVIAGAVPNPETPSPISDANQTMAAITTGGGNRIHIEDQEGSERILLHSPRQTSFIRIGAPNDPPPEGQGPWKAESEAEEGSATAKATGVEAGAEAHGIKFSAEAGLLDIVAKDSHEIILGDEFSLLLGFMTEIIVGMATSLKFGGLWDLHLPEKWTVGGAKVELTETEFKSKVEKLALGANETRINTVWEVMAGMATHVRGTDTKVSELDNDVRGQGADLFGTQVAVAGNATKSALSELAARVSKLESAANKISTSATNVTTAGTSVSSSGVKTASNATRVVNNGLNVSQTTSVDIRDAPLSFNG